MRSRLIFAALLTLSIASLPVHAASVILVDDVDMAVAAELVLRGRVLDQEGVEIDGRIFTDYRLAVLDNVRGSLKDDEVQVRVPGGVLPDGSGRKVFGAPEFAPGEDLLLFLHGKSKGAHRLVHLMQGAFREVELAGEPALLRFLDDTEVMPLKGRDPAEENELRGVRHRDRFVQWLRDLESSSEAVKKAAPKGDYMLTVSEAALGSAKAQVRAKFTLLATPGFRWDVFDTNGAVTWLRHQAGQPGFADGGLAAFTRARAAWNNEPNTPIRYVDGGTTANTTGFNGVGFRSLILFSDLNDEIMTDFNCSTGGTLAIGGVDFIRGGGPRQWKGDPFNIIVEGGITMNNNTQCIFGGNPLGLEEVYAHEMGHSLGLGHSCGDMTSPSCATSTVLNQALMRAQAHNDQRGSSLRSDDLEGIRFLYDPTFFPNTGGGGNPMCDRPVGSGAFCQNCGPCAQGEGDCNVDSDCQTGLTCAQNVGAQFGFRPHIDVCVGSNGGGGGGGTPTPCNLPAGSSRFCTECGPCQANEGDCDSDSECLPGTTCVSNVGAQFGFNPAVDVCLAGPGGGGTCTRVNGHSRFCTECGPCQANEGDCDSDSECAPGLTCVSNVGAQFGFNPAVDVCM